MMIQLDGLPVARFIDPDTDTPPPYLRAWFVMIFLVSALLFPYEAFASDLVLEEEAEIGVSTAIGPQVSLNGPPTAFKVRAQFWRALTERFSFVASVGVVASGETTLGDGSDELPEAHFDSTFGAAFQAGVRMLMDSYGMPFQPHARAGLRVDVVGDGDMIGYLIGPSAAIGLAYPLSEVLEITAESELGVGLGQYKGVGTTLAATIDLMVGAQIRF